MYNNAYISPPSSGLASLLSSQGRNGDSVLVHMAPEEVKGLQALAMAHGGSLTINPETGLYEASFLKKILPMVAGAFLGPAGYGLSPFAAAATVGLGYGLIEGDLQKGLMAGLGAYSGANITGAFKAAGTPAGEVPKTGSTVTTEAPPAPKFGAVSAKDNILYGGQAPRGFDVDPNVAKNWAASNTPPAGAAAAQAATTVKPPMFDPSTKFGAVAQGARNVFTGQQGAPKQFMDALGGPISQYATFMGAATPFAEEPKGIDMSSMGEGIMYIPGGPNPLYGTGANQPQQLPGKYYKKTAKGLVPYNPYQMAPGYASGGYVDVLEEGTLPRQEVMPYPVPNQNYPLSTVVRANYSPATPRPREVVGGYGPKMDPFTGEEKFAEGGDVKEDPNVAANRAYVEELNRRAMKPTFTPYGMIAGGTGGLGGANAPWTGTNPYGGALNTMTGGQQTTGGGTEDALMNLAAMYGIQKGLGSLTGNAAFQEWLTKMGLKKAADTTAATGTGTTTGTGGQQTTTGQQTQTGGQQTTTGQQTQTGGQQTQTGTGTTTTTGTGTDVTKLDPDLAKLTNVGGDLSKLSALMKTKSGLESLGTLGGLSSTGFGAVLPATITPAGVTGLQSLSSGMAPSGSIASQYGGMKGALEAGANTGTAAQSGLSTLQNKVIPGIGTALGAYNTAKAIEQGKEGQAALSAATTAASAAKLLNIGALGGPAGMLAAAAIAAIGASLVNTKEFGDVALRNYWNAVDAGRGIGQTDPVELAQGFINFYRTNKNEFAGQEKYGRTGNEDFVYDMTQVINNAVKDGKVSKDVDAATMYKEVVQPWLNSMGSGPKNEEARAIQDFMMTDMINSFMQGKPISNAQVKNDKKYKIVSEKPVYAGAVAAPQQTQPTSGLAARNPFAEEQPVRADREIMEEPMYMGDMSMMTFADGGAIGDDYNFGFAGGGMPEYKAGGKLLDGPGDGMSDSIPAVIRGKGVQRAALADGEFVVPADVVSHLGNGSTKAGAKKLYAMMDRVRQARTGSKRQAPAVKTDRLLPA